MQTRQITVIYEDGVFKPLEEVNVKEHEKLLVTLYPDARWQKEVDDLFKKVHKKIKSFSPKEIETDISKARKEARKQLSEAHRTD